MSLPASVQPPTRGSHRPLTASLSKQRFAEGRSATTGVRMPECRAAAAGLYGPKAGKCPKITKAGAAFAWSNPLN